MILQYEYYPHDNDDQIEITLRDQTGQLPALNGHVDDQHLKPLIGRNVTDDEPNSDDLDFLVGAVNIDDIDDGRRRYLIDLIEQSIDAGMEVAQ